MRPTKEIEVGGVKFVVKTYLTAKESNAVQQTYFKDAKVELVGEQPKISDFKAGVKYDVEKELIRQAVISMDGNDVDVVNRCEELPADDFNTLVAEIDALTSKKRDRAGGSALRSRTHGQDHADGRSYGAHALDVR